MRTLFFILLVALTPLIGASPWKATIVGKWLHSYTMGESSKIVGTTTYYADGRFKGRSVIFEKSKQVEEVAFEGTWTLKGTKLTMLTRYIGKPDMKDPIELTSEIIELTEKKYVYKTAEGIVLSEQRIVE